VSAAHFDAIILGGGAAGLFCAGVAAQRGRRVLVLERNAEPGAKILISGGGRCNFTNVHAGPERFLSENPHFARSALARYTPEDFCALVRGHGISFYEKTLGQLFCEGAGSARGIVRMLLDEAATARIDTGVTVRAVTRSDAFIVETDRGAFSAPALVLATGGLSIPKLGASDLALRIAMQFGLAITPPRPGLVPLTFSGGDKAWMEPLAGVSTTVRARAGAAEFREAALFTHRGLSGPAILQVSSYWRAGETIAIDWAPDANENALVTVKRARPVAHIKAALASIVPERLAGALAASLPPTRLGDIKDAALIEAARGLKAFTLTPSGTEGYAKAEVTVGGIDTRSLDQRTMGARDVPGLFCIGEAVDVTGWLGGYNFHWAWASGFAAGQAI
jgi:predicted Rossmann fold flavoprotein